MSKAREARPVGAATQVRGVEEDEGVSDWGSVEDALVGESESEPESEIVEVPEVDELRDAVRRPRTASMPRDDCRRADEARADEARAGPCPDDAPAVAEEAQSRATGAAAAAAGTGAADCVETTGALDVVTAVLRRRMASWEDCLRGDACAMPSP